MAADLCRLPLTRVYVGLNDLSIDRGLANIFTSVADGTVSPGPDTDAGATLDLGAGLKVVGAGGLGAAMGMERFDMRFGA